MVEARTHVELSELLNLVVQWREKGLKIGWTNGCFDVIHAGHVSMLAFARENCDRLIVGINSDSSVKKLKGERRPYHTLADRLAVLTAIRTVDAVVVLKNDTPIHEIRQVRPDLVVKDDSYRTLPMPERSVVNELGGKVMLFPRLKGHSTSNILSSWSCPK